MSVVCFSLKVIIKQILGKPYVMRHKGGAWRGEMTIQLGSTSYFVCSESWMQECHHCLFNASVKEFILAHLKKESQQQTPKKILYKSSIS